MPRFEWKSLAQWKFPTPEQERRQRRGSSLGGRFRPTLDPLEGRALLSTHALAVHRVQAAPVSTVTQLTGGAGSQGSGGGGGVGVLAPINGSFRNGAVLNGPLPVVHVFNARGKVIGVRPVLPTFSISQRTGGPGGANGGGGGGGFSVLIPFSVTVPATQIGRFRSVVPVFLVSGPSAVTTVSTITQQTGGPGAGGGGGGGGFSILI